MKPVTPESIEPHKGDYQDGAWRGYTLSELGQWVALFTKRATHRRIKEKFEKDLYDAQNYLDMMQAYLNHVKNNFVFSDGSGKEHLKSTVFSNQPINLEERLG